MASKPVLSAWEGGHLFGEGLHSHSRLNISHSVSVPSCHASRISSHKCCLLQPSSRAVASWERPQAHLLTISHPKLWAGEGKTGVHVWAWGPEWGHSGPSHPPPGVFSWLHHTYDSLDPSLWSSWTGLMSPLGARLRQDAQPPGFWETKIIERNRGSLTAWGAPLQPLTSKEGQAQLSLMPNPTHPGI